MQVVHFAHPLIKKQSLNQQCKADTINEAIREIFEVGDFAIPTICVINGECILRKDWDKVLPKNTVVAFCSVPTDPVTITIAIVLSVAVAYALTSSIPDVDSDSPDSVYSLRGQSNQVKLNQEIECIYGKNKIYPSLAAQPYRSYINNEQYLYSLYSLGHGDFDVESVGYGESPITSFNDIEYEIYPPHTKVTLFPDNVIVSQEARGLELLAFDNTNYDGPSGPYRTNPSKTKTTRIELDFSLPQGLYWTTKKGKRKSHRIDWKITYKNIISNQPAIVDRHTKYLRTTTPQRFTISKQVPAGIYEVTVRRLTKHPGSNTIDTLRLEGMRAFLSQQGDYGDMTMVAVRAKATNSLNNSSSKKFFAIATRKLNVYNESTKKWQFKPTRSIAWAFYDVFTAKYGGMLTQKHLDLSSLLEFDKKMTEKGYTFDHVFTKKQTVWKAAQIIARVGRAVPMHSGSQIGIIVDEPKKYSSALFAPQNMIAGSFNMSYVLKKEVEYDGVKITYIDPSTYQTETVLCRLGGDQGNNYREIKLYGCQNRYQAYREGLYMRAKEKYGKRIVKFDTGMEGMLPDYGDRITITHDMPLWTQSGRVVEILDASHIRISENHDLTDSQTYKIQFRTKSGQPSEVMTVEKSSVPGVLAVSGDLRDMFYLDSTHDLPFYLIGTSEQLGIDCTVIKIEPQGNDVVSIECSVYDGRIYDSDQVMPPQLVINNSLKTVDTATVEDIAVAQEPNDLEQAVVTWQAIAGANKYIIDYAIDDQEYTRLGEVISNTIILPTPDPAKYYLRVSAVIADQGKWSYWNGRLGEVATVPSAVKDLKLLAEFKGLNCYLQWQHSALAASYQVIIKQDNAIVSTHNTTNAEFTYNYDLASSEGLAGRDFTFEVSAINSKGPSAATKLAVSNTKPAAIANATATSSNLNNGTYLITVNWDNITDNDIAGYRLWYSTTNNFTVGNYQYEGTGSAYSFIVPATTNGSRPTIYYRIAAFDVWDREDYTLSEKFTF